MITSFLLLFNNYVKYVNLFGVFKNIDYFCGVKLYIKKKLPTKIN